jgi:isopentenyl-diphosphate Delta-isomerase
MCCSKPTCWARRFWDWGVPTAAGVERPLLQALREGGEAAADAYRDRVERELRTVMLLTGSRSVEDLQRAPKIVLGELQDWLALGA